MRLVSSILRISLRKKVIYRNLKVERRCPDPDLKTRQQTLVLFKRRVKRPFLLTWTFLTSSLCIYHEIALCIYHEIITDEIPSKSLTNEVWH